VHGVRWLCGRPKTGNSSRSSAHNNPASKTRTLNDATSQILGFGRRTAIGHHHNCYLRRSHQRQEKKRPPEENRSKERRRSGKQPHQLLQLSLKRKLRHQKRSNALTESNDPQRGWNVFCGVPRRPSAESERSRARGDSDPRKDVFPSTLLTEAIFSGTAFHNRLSHFE